MKKWSEGARSSPTLQVVGWAFYQMQMKEPCHNRSLLFATIVNIRTLQNWMSDVAGFVNRFLSISFCTCLTLNRSMIPSRKSYVLLGSLQRLAGWLLLIFFIFFTQSIKFCTFHYHALRVQMFKNVNVALFSKFCGKSWVGFLS